MRKNAMLSIIVAIFSVFIFTGCSSETTQPPPAERTFVSDLTNKPLLSIVGEAHQDSPQHDLVKLSGGQKGDAYFNLGGKSSVSYEFVEKEGRWYLRMFKDGNLFFNTFLFRDCDEQGRCTIFAKDPQDDDRVVITLIEMPAGYEHIIKARNLAGEGVSSGLIAKNCKEAIEKASAEDGNYSKFIKLKAARLLLEKARETSDFLLARSVFNEFGMQGNVAQTEILFIATGEAVAAEDINGTAKLAWESIWADKNSSVYSLERAFYVAEAISFACAKVGNYPLAVKYHRDITDAVLHRKLTNREDAGLGLNKKVSANLLQMYEMGKMPAEFVTTVLYNNK